MPLRQEINPVPEKRMMILTPDQVEAATYQSDVLVIFDLSSAGVFP